MSYYKKYGVRYNFDRVMPDHRYIPDVSVKDRIPFTAKNYFNALKYVFIASAKKHPQAYFGVAVPVLFLMAFAIVTESTESFNETSMARNRLLTDYRYLVDKNRKELGAWNSQFNCFEKDPWCNKDQE